MEHITTLLVFRDEELNMDEKHTDDMELFWSPMYEDNVKYHVGYSVLYTRVDGMTFYYHAMGNGYQHMNMFLEVDSKKSKNEIHNILLDYYTEDKNRYNDQCDKVEEKIKTLQITIDSIKELKI